MIKIKLDNKDFAIKKDEILKWTQGNEMEVGFFESATYPGGEFVASVAIYNEFGTQNIPPRPFFRSALDKNEARYWNFLASEFVKNEPAKKSLTKLGELVRGDVIKSITQFSEPPNAPSTIKAKGSSNPLIDTGVMRF